MVQNGKLIISNGITIDFVRFNDKGDTYNFGAVEGDIPEIAKVISSKIIMDGNLRVGLRIKTNFFAVNIFLDKNSELLRFKIDWTNRLKNKLWQIRFKMKDSVTETYSEDLNSIIHRTFNPDYNIREHLPKTRGIEVWTNTAPMQRFVGTQGLGIVTKGLTEYEVFKNTLSVTLLRSTGIISNPKNPSRSTPAGPPIEVPEAQQLGKNTAEFAVGFFEPKMYEKYVNELFLS